MERRHGARGIHLENRAHAAHATEGGRPIEVSVAPLDQPGGGIRPIASRKGMERRHGARGIHLENRADVMRAALDRRSVEVSVARLDPSAELGTRPIAPGKGMEQREGARGSYLENRAEAARAAAIRRPVEVSVAPWISAARGRTPSLPVKEWSVVTVPEASILKTVPAPLAPFWPVVP